MIDYRFVQKTREKIDIPEETIEKDYLIEVLLNYLVQDSFLQQKLILRGGTAIKKVYFPEFRYSEDLDFIVKNRDDLRIFVANCEKILKKISGDLPIEIGQRPEFPQKGHLQLLVHYDIVPEIHLAKELKIDIVEDDVVLPSKKRKILFSFADFVGSRKFLDVYDLESIAAEKIGRILDVVDEPRDLWDLHYLLKLGLNFGAVSKLFREKYGVSIPLPNLVSAIKKPAYKKNWDTRLKNHVPNLIAYERIIEELSVLIRKRLRSAGRRNGDGGNFSNG